LGAAEGQKPGERMLQGCFSDLWGGGYGVTDMPCLLQEERASIMQHAEKIAAGEAFTGKVLQKLEQQLKVRGQLMLSLLFKWPVPGQAQLLWCMLTCKAA
jgi:hypothetical protein